MILSSLQASCYQVSLLPGFCCATAFSSCHLCFPGLTYFLSRHFCIFWLFFSPRCRNLLSFNYAVTGECQGPGAQQSDLLKPLILTLHIDTQHCSSFVIQMSDFPLQNKTTSNSLVSGSLRLLQKTPCCPMQLPSVPAELFSPVPSPTPQLPFLGSVEVKEGCWLTNSSCWFFFWVSTTVAGWSAGLSAVGCTVVQIFLWWGPISHRQELLD